MCQHDQSVDYFNWLHAWIDPISQWFSTFFVPNKILNTKFPPGWEPLQVYSTVFAQYIDGIVVLQLMKYSWIHVNSFEFLLTRGVDPERKFLAPAPGK